MNKLDTLDSSNMIFTLEDGAASGGSADWESSLNALRNRNLRSGPLPAAENAAAVVQPRRSGGRAAMPETFGDEELAAAYREFLLRSQAEHNARAVSVQEEDEQVLIQEDWLNAQSALQTEYGRRQSKQLKTLVLRADGVTDELPPQPVSGSLNAPEPALPDFAVHLYQLPDLPSTRRIRVVSEKELMAGIRERLKPHLTNAVAGMVRQVLQRKMAMLSYDLQTMLNDEAPQVVQDVLDYNLDVVFRMVKNQLRDKEQQ